LNTKQENNGCKTANNVLEKYLCKQKLL
jgi:hypothetical protein